MALTRPLGVIRWYQTAQSKSLRSGWRWTINTPRTGNHSIKALRILFDAHWLASGPPSGKSVVVGLIRGWKLAYPQDQLVLKVPHSLTRDSLEAQLCFSDFETDASGMGFSNHALSVVSSGPFKDYDVVLSQNFGSIFGDTLRCVFVHDALFKDHPEWFTKIERLYLSVLRPSLARTDIIFTSSEAEAARIRRVWPDLRKKVRAIGLGLPDWVEAEPSTPNSIHPNQRPYLLAVGRLNIRKNIHNLISAFAESVASQDHDLVIIGERNGLAGAVSSDVASVRFVTGASNAELKWFYLNAKAFVFPSLDEGFGLPLIEAHRFGLPICASDIPAFRELNVADILFDPQSVDDISRALNRVVSMTRRPDAWGKYQWSEVVTKARAEIVSALSEKGR